MGINKKILWTLKSWWQYAQLFCTAREIRPNYSKTKYDSKTNSWFLFISTSYNASSDNVTTRDDINYNRRVAFIKNIKNERLSPADRLSPSIYEIISTIVNDSEEEDDIEIRNIKIGKYSTTLEKLAIFWRK